EPAGFRYRHRAASGIDPDVLPVAEQDRSEGMGAPPVHGHPDAVVRTSHAPEDLIAGETLAPDGEEVPEPEREPPRGFDVDRARVVVRMQRQGPIGTEPDPGRDYLSAGVDRDRQVGMD